MTDENKRRIIKTMRCGCGMMMEPVTVSEKLIAKCPRCGNEEMQMSVLSRILFDQLR